MKGHKEKEKLPVHPMEKPMMEKKDHKPKKK